MTGLLLAEGTLSFGPSSERVGPAPDAIIYHHVFSRGTLDGPFMRFRAVAGGGEWTTLRGDGIIAVEARHMLQTEGQGFVYASYSGIYDLGEEGSARAEIAIRYNTAAAEYRWLNRLQCVALGTRDFTSS